MQELQDELSKLTQQNITLEEKIKSIENQEIGGI